MIDCTLMKGNGSFYLGSYYEYKSDSGKDTRSS